MDLVVGATGYLGGMIARRLLSLDREVRVLARPGSKYQPLVDAGARLAIGDLRDRASLDAACEGIDTVVTTAIPRPDADPATAIAINLDGNRNLIDAAQAAGVGHFVFTAGYGADPDSPVPFVAAKGKAEQYLRACGMSYTILEPDMLMDTVITYMVIRPIAGGQPVCIAEPGNDRHTFVAARDVAAYAIAAMDQPAARGRTLVIGGPAALTLREIVAAFEGILERPVPVHTFVVGQPPAGLSPLLAGLAATLPAYPEVEDPWALAEEFGVQLTSVESFARSHSEFLQIV